MPFASNRGCGGRNIFNLSCSNWQGACLDSKSGVVGFAVLVQGSLLVELPWWMDKVSYQTAVMITYILTRIEVRAILARTSGAYDLMANLPYGTKMRLMECVCLRLKDVDFECEEICIHDAAGVADQYYQDSENTRYLFHLCGF